MTGWSSFILILYENKSLVYHSETQGDVTLKHLWFNTFEINCDFLMKTFVSKYNA